MPGSDPTPAQAEDTVALLEQRSSSGGDPELCEDICAAIAAICPLYEDLCERLKALKQRHGCECGGPEG